MKAHHRPALSIPWWSVPLLLAVIPVALVIERWRNRSKETSR